MGVQGLWETLESVARPTKLESLSQRKLAVDASIWIYQFLKAVRDKEGNALRNSHIVGFFRRICKLLFYGIKPVFVFDGGAPSIKKKTITARKLRREGKSEDLARNAEKLMSLQLRHIAEEQLLKEKNALSQKNSNQDDSQENVKTNISSLNKSPLKNNQSQFRKNDPYHLPDIDGNVKIIENDPRVLTHEELAILGEDVQNDGDIGLYDTSKIDFFSPAFLSLPLPTQYRLLNTARLRSRLRMGYTKEQLQKLFPNKLEFSKFQIERVAYRNMLTTKLMNLNGMEERVAPQRVAGEKGTEYILSKNDDGWTLALSNENSSANPIEIRDNDDPMPSDESSDDGEWEDASLTKNTIKEDLNNNSHFNHQDIDNLFAANSQDLPLFDDFSWDVEDQIDEMDESELQKAIANSLKEMKANQSFLQESNNLDPKVSEEEIKKAENLFANQAGPFLWENDDETAEKILNKKEISNKPTLNDYDSPFSLIESEEKTTESENDLTKIDNENKAEIKKKDIKVLPPWFYENAEKNDNFQNKSPLNNFDEFSIVSPPTVETIAYSFDNNMGHEFNDSNSIQKIDNKEPIVISDIEQPIESNVNKKVSKPSTLSEYTNIENNINSENNKSLVLTDENDLLEKKDIEPLTLSQYTNIENNTNSENNKSLILTDDNDLLERKDIKVPDILTETKIVHDDNIEPSHKEVSAVKKDIEDIVQLNNTNMIEKKSYVKNEIENGNLQSMNQSLSKVKVEEFSDNDSEISWSESEDELINEATTKNKTTIKNQHESEKNTSSEQPDTYKVESNKDKDEKEDNTLTFQKKTEDENIDNLESKTVNLNENMKTEGNAMFDDGDDEEISELLEQLTSEAQEHARFAGVLNKSNKEIPTQEDYEQELKELRADQRRVKRDADEVTLIMVKECQELLGYFGIPYIVAPMEAEAQCAELLKTNQIDGIITDDSDVFLFGGTRIYKNMFNQGKYVELFLGADIERELHLDQKKMICLAHLLGSDYAEGLPGIGPVAAMEILAEFYNEDTGIRGFKEWWRKVQNGESDVDVSSSFKKKFISGHKKKLFIPNSFLESSVDKAYLDPTVDSDTSIPFVWGKPDLDNLRKFLMSTIGWSKERTDEVLLPVIKDMNKKLTIGSQRNITDFYQGKGPLDIFAPRERSAIKSKRLEKAVDTIGEKGTQRRKKVKR